MASIISLQVIGSPFSARTFAAAFRQLNWPSWPLVSACFPFAFPFAFVLVLLLSLMIHLRFRWMLPSSGRAQCGPALRTYLVLRCLIKAIPAVFQGISRIRLRFG